MIWLLILGALPTTIAVAMCAALRFVEGGERDEFHSLHRDTQERTVQAG